MKRIGAIFSILILVLFFAGNAQSQPISGIYDTRDGDFDAGTWTEILYGGAEGKAGNEIQSGATEFYRFEGAILNDVILLGTPTEGQPFYEYRTVYKGGTLTLYNKEGAGWYNAAEGEPEEYVVDLKNTIVVTKKYVQYLNDEASPTGEIEFALFVVDARFKDYHGYSACITAKFDKGLPEPVVGSDYPEYGGDLSWIIISIKGPEYVEVPVDIKPGSCPNPVNVVSKGVLPVAILGTEKLDVTQIDPETILLNGVKPLRWAFEDVGTPYSPCKGKWDAYACNEYGPDGYMDLSLKFDTQAFVASLGEVDDREVVTVPLSGYLKDGTPIQGEDVIVILAKAKTQGMSTVVGSILELIRGQGAKK